MIVDSGGVEKGHYRSWCRSAGATERMSAMTLGGLDFTSSAVTSSSKSTVLSLPMRNKPPSSDSYGHHTHNNRHACVWLSGFFFNFHSHFEHTDKLVENTGCRHTQSKRNRKYSMEVNDCEYKKCHWLTSTFGEF